MVNRSASRPRRGIHIAFLVLIGTAALTSCSQGPSTAAKPSSSPADSPTNPAPRPEVVTWLDQVCSGLNAQSKVLSSSSYPQIPQNPTEADRRAAVAYLTDARDAFRRSKKIFDKIDTAPVDGGDEAVAAARRETDRMLSKLEEYRSNTKRFPAPEFGAPFRLALMDLLSYSPGADLTDLRDRDPVVAAAYKRAENCTR